MWCKQAFAINPMRLVFPYFGVIMNLLQCCGLCRELLNPSPTNLLLCWHGAVCASRQLHKALWNHTAANNL